jgi:hypothetical protein
MFTKMLGFMMFLTGAGLMAGAPEPSPDEPLAVEWSVSQSSVPVSKKRVYVIETLPSAWPVSSAVDWIDRYTGSDWVMAKSCPKGAYRCVFVKSGDLRAPRLGETRGYAGSRVTIYIDLPYANKRAKTYAHKKWVLAHEFGHAAGLREHSSSSRNLMYRHIGAWKYGVTASQSRQMARR